MRKAFIIMFCLCFFVLLPAHSSASVSVPYKTETLSADGEIIETQTAYVPLGIFQNDIDIVSPEDLFIDEDDHIFVADSGTQTVVKFDQQGNVQQSFGEGILQQPLSVYVDHEQDVYVADYAQEMVYRFSEDGDLLEEYGRPESPLFGARSPYKPQKVSVDRRGNIYIVGEGSTNGIIQLNQDGAFLGYYGVNHSRQTVLNFFQDLVTTERQRERLFSRVPPAPTNISIDEQGLVYTVTSGTDFEVIRKLNIAGANMLPPEVSTVTNLRDIDVGPIGNIYTVGNDGKIYEYDRYGNLLFMFGGRDDGTSRNGLFMQPTSIAVDNVGRLYVSDREQGDIQILEPTEFTSMLHQGLALYAEGFYLESEEYWNDILKLNSSFGLAHSAMGEVYFKQQHYNEAVEEFRLAENREGYSLAFWEIRHEWMQSNLAAVFALLLAVFGVKMAVNYADKKRNILQPVRKSWTKIKARKLVRELLFLFRFLRHPIDSFYYLKEYERVSVLSATILYAVLFLQYMFMLYWTGFIFSDQRVTELNLFLEMGTVFLPIFLFIVTNYLVSTINDGEGRLRDIYIGTIYSLAPVLVLLVPITLISNVLTYNEAFVYTFSTQIMIVWSLVILFMMIREVHDFTFFGTIRNILVTLFGMFIMILVFFVLYILLDQVLEFIITITQEVIHRV
ncbi:YIP1 family protein [Alteribacter keqinensis]|uniref:Yip1 domain-containing protein n=1 Tax=Alteribacter keqinensis TaxID=2483800 RepID=A0A3M7TS50_9BACI|nr:YIP1 family protein [Alteribacter keqinensis]RNA68430.1 hypothetical protein EBO34_00170 [Alteribacter keqinensis]